MQWIRESSAPIDLSEQSLRRWKAEGYIDVVFAANPNCCQICRRLSGKRYKIDDLLKNMQFEAALYSISHIGCKCGFRKGRKKFIPKKKIAPIKKEIPKEEETEENET